MSALERLTILLAAITWDMRPSPIRVFVSLSDFPMARSMNVCSPGSTSTPPRRGSVVISSHSGFHRPHFKRVLIATMPWSSSS